MPSVRWVEADQQGQREGDLPQVRSAVAGRRTQALHTRSSIHRLGLRARDSGCDRRAAVGIPCSPAVRGPSRSPSFRGFRGQPKGPVPPRRWTLRSIRLHQGAPEIPRLGPGLRVGISAPSAGIRRGWAGRGRRAPAGQRRSYPLRPLRSSSSAQTSYRRGSVRQSAIQWRPRPRFVPHVPATRLSERIA